VSEAMRIRLAYLFDPRLAVHTSRVTPYPHQITAVYECMLPRQPLRFLLADDPGAGKTIMAGLLIKELMVRGDVLRCLIVCPGNLGEQWQDELNEKFDLRFQILTNDNLEASRTGNWFVENNLVIARLDKLSRNENIQKMLQAPDAMWDLVVCDEAHKMAATVFGGEIKYTKRYHLGELLAGVTRHFLLMSATPHNGKELDFQLFMALLDRDRFETSPKTSAHASDVSDVMRRMVKEKLLKFDGTRLFPERIAYTVPFKLSPGEADLYQAVTAYVREEFNRVERLGSDKRKATVGFALTILQRRLASSPEAIYQSLRRRRERLEDRLVEAETRQAQVFDTVLSESILPPIDMESLDDFEDAPDAELAAAEDEIVLKATAASTIAELKAEIQTLSGLESAAAVVTRSDHDTKWAELAGVLDMVFRPVTEELGRAAEALQQGQDVLDFTPSPHQKIVIFTEHRDTLNYLHRKISTLLGRREAVIDIHGAMNRKDRRAAEQAFINDPQVQVLIATDAAGEGINLQRAHLMVNYDLPWNPNRIEQRFGRIHRIGQSEVCHLWNLVADETREGDVYRRLLEKLEQARQALGGQVFDVLGKLQFGDESLRDLLIRAIRYGDQPDVRARLTQVVESALDREHITALLDENALAHEVMDSTRVQLIREDMERADIRKLQPFYVGSFFVNAFRQLGGEMREREPRRYEITNVPRSIREQVEKMAFGKSIPSRFERVTFDKDQQNPPDKPRAEFLCPGHPLMDAVLELTMSNNRDVLRAGAALVDETDSGTQPRIVYYLEHALRDAVQTRAGEFRDISRRMMFIEVESTGTIRNIQYAPYLDYRPLNSDEPAPSQILERPECAWIQGSGESKIMDHAVSTVVPKHLEEVRKYRLDLIARTRAAVQERLSSEIRRWDKRAAELKAQERAGKVNAKLNWAQAQARAEELAQRQRARLDQLKLEEEIRPAVPVVVGGVLVVPIGLIRLMSGETSPTSQHPVDTQAAAARAREIVMQAEQSLGFEPVDREFERLGYDIESRDPKGG
ncbi:MAG TPA: helicase-related protein, partial [Myxococcota bacterium]|nr:helicase-related protein [Myxococcota bacterium]